MTAQTLHLLSPLDLAPSVRLRNRVVFQPHFTSLGRRDGFPSEDHVTYHEVRAQGGVGLIVFESQAVLPSGKMNRHMVHAWDDGVVPHYRVLTGAVKRAGGAIISQLTHGGHTTAFRPPEVLWAPTQLPEPSEAWSTKAMDEEDIRQVIIGFAQAARNALAGGFDGVEVKIAHDGLLRSFASPYFNHRQDRWGGSFENRMRLSLEVLDAVREALGDGPALGARLCLSEFTDWGYDLSYGLRMAEAIEQTGTCDYFNCDHGSYSSTWYEIPPFAIPEGSFRELNAGLKRATDLRVIASGRIRTPELAEEILAAGEADMIGMARQLITDPEWVNKLAQGRAEEIRLCIACNDACVFQTSQGKPIRCSVNPLAGRERHVPPLPPRRPEVAPARVVVIGGGPAGLQAAVNLRESGHEVTLIERDDRLGGQIRWAAAQPLHGEILDSIGYLEGAARRLGVRLEPGVEADAEMIRALDPSAVLVATGSDPGLPGRPMVGADTGKLARRLGRQVLPSVRGLDLPHIRSSDECYLDDSLRDLLVVIVDGVGHWETAGTAELLAERGCRVEVVTAGPIVGAMLDEAGRVLWTQRARKEGIRLSPNLALLELVDEGAAFEDLLSGETIVRSADVVVPVIGRRSREDLFLELSQAGAFGPLLCRAGDCVSPRLLQQAIAEADLVARELAGRLAARDEPVAA